MYAVFIKMYILLYIYDLEDNTILSMLIIFFAVQYNVRVYNELFRLNFHLMKSKLSIRGNEFPGDKK